MMVLFRLVWLRFLVLLKTNLGNGWATLAALCDLLHYTHFDRQGIYKDVSKDMGLFCRKRITVVVSNSPGLNLLLVEERKYVAAQQHMREAGVKGEKLGP